MNAPGGSQSYTLLTANLPAYTPSGVVNITDPGHNHSATTGTPEVDVTPIPGTLVAGVGDTNVSTEVTGITAAFVGVAQGGTSTPFSRIQPTLTADYIIKALPDDLPTGPGVTSIQGMTGVLFCGTGMICTAQTISSGLAVYATALEVQAGIVADKIIAPAVLWPTEAVTTYGTTTTFDFQTFKNTSVTLTGDITTQTLTNVVPGKAGMITFIQDGSGNHTTVWNSIFKFSSGTLPTLTTTAGAVDILSYSCRSATFCAASLLTDVK